MSKVGICGINGQIGSHLSSQIGTHAVEVDRAGRYPGKIDCLVWAAGSTTNRSKKEDTLAELAQAKRTLNGINFSAIQHVVLISSGGSVYGSHSVLPLNEETPLNPQTPYGNLKVEIEREFQSLSNKHKFQLSILRLANVYSMKGKGLVSTVANCVETNEAFTFQVHPNSRKQYGNAADYARAILNFIRNPILSSRNIALNLFAPHSYSIREILNLGREFTKFPILNSIGSLHLPLETIILDTKFPNHFGEPKEWSEISSFFNRVKRGEL